MKRHHLMTVSDARCFAVRRVNPFEGVLQVLELPGARAYSADGVTWQIQVQAERPDHTWRSLGDAMPVRQFFNFGLWDAEDGLHRVPANPVLDIGAMSKAAGELTDTLRSLLDRLPFTQIDRYECWSVDRAGCPVALLATTEDASLIARLRVSGWQATRRADCSFVAPSCADQDAPSPGRPDNRECAERLERIIRDRGPDKTWFERLGDGQARRVGPTGEPLGAATTALPPLVLDTEFDDPAARRLVIEYVDWLAPRLLLLDPLGDELRGRLEQAACRRAAEIEAVYRLIPRIIDAAALSAARVEARLRCAGAAAPST
jgi:hypothetical protein